MKGYEHVEDLKKDFDSLSKMDEDTRAELVRTYHTSMKESISKAIGEIEKVNKLSPVTPIVTKTAMIIAERDFTDKDIQLCCCVGNVEEMKKLISELWDMMESAFTDVAKEKGYEKK